MSKSNNAPQPCRLEPLENRLLWSVTPSSAVSAVSPAPPGANLPPGVSNGVAEPVTISTTAGAVFSGSVGKVKRAQLPPNTKVLASIDWGDGQSSTGYVTKLATGSLQITGRHTWKFGGTYAVTVSSWGVPDAPPGVPVPAIAYPLPTIYSKAIVTGNPAPRPFVGTGVTLTLTAGAPFNGKVGSFRLATVPSTGVLSAGIDWGDGTSSAGVISRSSDGSYVVTGRHTYAGAGSFAIQTTVSFGPPTGPGPQPLFPSRILGTIDSKAVVAPNIPTEQGTATLVSGLLTVRGTNLADRIDITQTPVATAAGSLVDKVIVKINAQTFSFLASAVKTVEVYGRGGADNINLHGEPPPTPIPVSNGSTAAPGVTPPQYVGGIGLRVAATVYGGWGDDIILGGNAGDILFGGLGTDTLNGGLGKDVLHGDEGDDSLIASPGLDSAYGGAGFDVAVIIGQGVPPPPNSPPPVFYTFGYIDPDVEVVAIPP